MGYLNEIMELEACGLSREGAEYAHFCDMVESYMGDEDKDEKDKG